MTKGTISISHFHHFSAFSMNVTENISYNATEQDVDKRAKYLGGERKWMKAHEPWMIQIVPGLILGNLESSWNTEMHMKNRVKVIISISDAQWGRWGVRREGQLQPIITNEFRL